MDLYNYIADPLPLNVSAIRHPNTQTMRNGPGGPHRIGPGKKTAERESFRMYSKLVKNMDRYGTFFPFRTAPQ